MTSTSAAGDAGIPPRPNIPSGEEIFNLLMEPIEPELVMDDDAREAQYAGEAPEEQQRRMVRYRDAFVKYKAAAKEYFAKLSREVGTYRKATLTVAEEETKQLELEKLAELETLFT